MALKDIWKDLQNAIEGVPNSGDDISADTINAIARAVIDLENDGVGGLADVAKTGSYNDLTDTPNLSAVATSGKYEDLTDKPITILSDYPNTDEKLNELIDGVYCYADTTVMPSSNVLLIASHTEDWFYIDEDDKDKGDYKREQWTQVIIDDKGVRKRQKTNYRNFTDGTPAYTIDWQDVPLDDDLATKEMLDKVVNDLSKVATSGSYADLANKPITVFETFPQQSDIDDMLYGTFIYATKYYWEPSIMVIAGCYNEEINETPDGDWAKTYTYRQHIVDSRRGFYAREKAICDNYADWNYDWREIPLNGNTATKEYVDSAIGDALEEVY